MTKKIFIFQLLLAPLQAFSQSIDSLRQEINQIISTKNATVGVSIKSIEGKEKLNINGDLDAPMMSVFKFHIGLTVLDQVDKGKLSLDQKIFIKKADLHAKTWSPIRDDFPNGDMYLTLDQLLRYTVSHSDNNGCDILLELLGGTETVQNLSIKKELKNLSSRLMSNK